MSLFDSASLVVTPNGYKEDKLYSIKPTDGSGDLVVTRATTATRVNSAGLVELVPYNLLTYSQEFNDASWVKSNSSITANATTAPDGTLTADKLVENSSNANHLVQKAVSATDSVYTFSVFAKKSERNWVVLRSVNASLQNVKAWFNIDAGTIGTLENGATANITNVGNGWYKLEMTIPSFSTGFEFRVSTSTGNNVDSYTGDGTSGLFIWGAQLVSGSSAKEYFPTTDRLNVPRLDYTNSSCPSILVEPQRTNLLTYSEGNLSTYDVSDNCTNASISISGFINSIQVPSTGLTYFYKTATTTSLQIYTLSCFIKMDDNSAPVLGTNSSLGNLSFVAKGAIAPDNLKVTLIGNNIYRISATTVGNGIPGFFGIVRYSSQTLKTFKISAIQLEAGSYATSYIPTVASSVTRNADVISKTGISSLIGQTEGTIYAEVKVSKLIGTASRYIFHISDGTANNRIYMAFSGSSSNVLRGRIFSGGTLQCSIDTSTLTNTGTYKIALAYKNNDIVFYVNGVQIGTDTSATIPTCSRVDLGQNYAGASQLGDSINNANIWKTRLTNTELATLTTI